MTICFYGCFLNFCFFFCYAWASNNSKDNCWNRSSLYHRRCSAWKYNVFNLCLDHIYYTKNM